MNSTRKTAVITGVIFIIATVVPFLASSLVPAGRSADRGQSPILRTRDELAFKKSQTLETGIRGLDIGDVDGDKKNEVLAMDNHNLYVFKFDGEKLSLFRKIEIRYHHNFLTLDVADLNRNGVAEIIVTSVVEDNLQSLIIEYEQREFRVITKKSGWFYRVLEHPKDGPVLMGQQMGSDGLFTGPIYKFVWKKNSFEKGAKMGFPKDTKIFGFAVGDVRNEGKLNMVMLDRMDKITILSPDGKPVWTSRDRFCGNLDPGWVLIASHYPNLAINTDVASRPEFASRKRENWPIDGELQSGWFAHDFTLAEIKTLGVVATDPERPQQYNGKFRLVTLQEVIDLVKAESRRLGRSIAVYPETKNPTYHRELALPLEDKLIGAIRAAGWNSKTAPVFVQSFEPGSLKEMRAKGLKVRMVQLIDADGYDLKTGGLTYPRYRVGGIDRWARPRRGARHHHAVDRQTARDRQAVRR